MNGSVFRALVRKDLYLMRPLIIATLVAGAVAFVLMRFGRIGFAVGGILFLTTNVAGGIFIAMLSVLTERVKGVQLFALGLPVSGVQYWRAKLLSTWLTYGIPWGALAAMVVLSFLLAPEAGRGMVVYALMLQGFVLALFGVVLAAMFLIRSEPLSGIVILVVNIAFSLFMVKVNQPEVVGLLRTDHVVWTPFSQGMLAGEVLVILGSLVFVMVVTSRIRDHV